MVKAKKSEFADELVAYVSGSLEALRDPEKSVEMAAYMRTNMPFYGVQKPDRIPILRQIKKDFKPFSFEEYRSAVLALWRQSHREEKYFAINYADSFPDFINPGAIALYEQMIREGQWWDFVDPIAIDLIGEVFLEERSAIKPIIIKWSKDKDFWIRRATLICQMHHKSATDEELLFQLCLKMAHEKEFFIQKAIGWALREYSKTNAKAVTQFLTTNKKLLAPLSYREGAKHLIREGVMNS